MHDPMKHRGGDVKGLLGPRRDADAEACCGAKSTLGGPGGGTRK